MSKTVLTRMQEENLRRALVKLAKTNSVEGHYGIIDFTYDEVIRAADEKLNSRSYVSLWLSALEAAGKLVRLRTGNAMHPSRWDVRSFIQAAQPKAPQKAPEAKLEEQQDQMTMTMPQPGMNREATIQLLQATIQDMTKYLQHMSTDMIQYLTTLSKDLVAVDHTEMEKAHEVITRQQQELSRLQADNEKLVVEMNLKERELESRPHLNVNKAMIIRQVHQIVDEVDRYQSMPKWTRSNSHEHFKVQVQQRLQIILNEIGAGDA